MSWATDWKKLDLDRLHANHPNRRDGRTMRHLAAMVGEAHLGQPGNNYVYVAETYNMKTWVCKDFRDILRHENISFTPNGGYRRDEVHVEITRLFVKGWKGVRTFDFMAASELGTRCRGSHWNRAFIDVSPSMRIQFEEGFEILKLCCGDDYVY